MADKKFRVPGAGPWHRAKAASTANVTVATLDVGQVLDGVTLALNDIVLLKNQTTGSENGLYKIRADGSAPLRSTTDQPAGTETSGSVVRVTSGTANAGKCYLQYAEPGVAGTDALVYIEHPRN